jgi:hypothetical protein
MPRRKGRHYRQARGYAAGLMALGFAGCGYIGNTLPPTVNRPTRVEDLSAVERGSKIVIQFTLPKITTEGQPIKGGKDRNIELRVGPPPEPFNLETWERTSELVDVPQDKSLAQVEVPASKYYGKTVDIAVNVEGRSGHASGWSMFVVLPVIEALPTPAGLDASNAPDAIHLEWRGAAPEYRVFRKLVADPNWTQSGTTDKPSYTDSTIEYGKTYQYYVQSIEKLGNTYAESEESDVKTFMPVDRFPPAMPAGVLAVPGTRSIELVWQRNTEKDFGSYTVYRDGKKIADQLTAPAYSDRDVKPKVKYEYQVSAVDNASNESTKSPIAEGVIP